METVRTRGFSIEQKRLFYHFFLTMFVAFAVAWSLHKPRLVFMMMTTSWMVSIFYLGRVGFRRITAGVLTMGVLMYLLARFFLTDLP